MYSRRMAINLVLSGFIANVTGACAQAQTVTGKTDLKSVFADLASKAKAEVDKGAVAGIAIGLSNGKNRLNRAYGYADIRNKRPMTIMTPMRIASVTKPITASAILRLRENGWLDLSQTIDHFFPDFPKSDQITIYHLLTHTAGIPNWWGRLPEDAPDDFMSTGEAHLWLARMDQISLFEPGTFRDYSNSGYLLLGEIIERVTGSPFQAALKELILSRFGALTIEMENPHKPKPGWAKGYQNQNGSLIETGFEPMPFAAGGLRSSLNDLQSFSDALFTGRLLKKKSLDMMTAHATLDDGRPVEDGLYVPPGTPSPQVFEDTTELGYGLGVNTWVQSGERFYSHAGLISGFGSYWIHAPRTGISAVILANTQGGTNPIHESVRSALRKIEGLG